MLNRRSLRIKAFKNLYSYESCKGANYLMGLDLIDKAFSPDLNSMEIVDTEELDQKKEWAVEEYQSHFEKKEAESQTHEEVKEQVAEALTYVEKQNKTDFDRLLKDVVAEATKISRDQVMVLSLLEELAFVNKKLADEKMSLTPVLGDKAQKTTNLFANKVIGKIKDSTGLQKSKQDLKISWDLHQDQLRDWYKGVLNKDDAYKEYAKKENTNYEEDWGIVDYICRDIIFKKDAFVSFFEDLDLDWSENKPIVRSLVLKTLKNIKNETDELELAEVSYNWEDDVEYVKDLFKITAKEDERLEDLLKGKLQNWDIERVAMTDKVLLKMAVAELINFPSIPTKVTINEFIEISKTFSTPKSKKFVNGILDGLSAELMEQGVIKKSGRGLIDNK